MKWKVDLPVTEVWGNTWIGRCGYRSLQQNKIIQLRRGKGNALDTSPEKMHKHSTNMRRG